MSDLMKLTLAGARDALRAGETTAVELTEASLAAVAASKPLNAFVHDTSEIARSQAKAADARVQAGDAPDMCGLPIGMKDLFCTKGVATQAASAILDGFKPEYESTVSQKLFDAGAVMVGKLNMDEFAMGSSNETSVYGNAVNPWKVDERYLTPGGSSGGFKSIQDCARRLGRDALGAKQIFHANRQTAHIGRITGLNARICSLGLASGNL